MEPRLCLQEIKSASSSDIRQDPALTILNERVQALLDEQCRIEGDKPVAQRKNIVAGPHLEEGSDSPLCTFNPISLLYLTRGPYVLTKPSVCSRSTALCERAGLLAEEAVRGRR